ncbi:MAG: 7-cyano-7-deazaguanine synthase QueC [Elusimicrobia bacterium]|nr:7-cyano-7-deazaguanine synthase QueC [Elusimicrobiota bacterium]
MVGNGEKKAVILLSGGMDSAVCLAIARETGYNIYTLTFDYGQRNRVEIDKARCLAEKYGSEKHLEFGLDLRKIGGSALTDDIEVPRGISQDVPVTYVPARNLIFLSVAVAWAEVLGAGSVFIGANVRDYSGYPDCREDFLKSFEKTAGLGTKKETKVSVKAPLIKMSKAMIVREGRRLGVDFSVTSSCYDPDDAGAECGTCESCRLREKGFVEADR